jgi:hypothetical protein
LSTHKMFYKKKCDDSFKLESLINDGRFILNSLSRPRKSFMIDIFKLYLCIQGEINFPKLSEYGGKSKQYYHKQFRKKFDDIGFNGQLIQQVASKNLVFEIRLVKIPKNGIATYGKDMIDPRVSETDRNGIAFIWMTVFDIENETSFHLKAVQLPTLDYLKKYHVTIQDYGLSLVGCTMRDYPDISQYLYVDEFFIRSLYWAGFKNTGLHLVSQLKVDLALYYVHHEKLVKKAGRPPLYGEKVNFSCLDTDQFKIAQETDEYRISSAIVWNKTIRQKFLVVVVDSKNSSRPIQKRYFTTDENLDPLALLEYCRSSIHTEALLHDAVRYTGLYDCQAIDQDKLSFHVNTSFSAVNIAKAELWLQKDKSIRGAFSMEKAKRYYYNKYLFRKREGTKHLIEEYKRME